ncbi:hypothetical protein D3C86_1583210 [compost metagenome]
MVVAEDHALADHVLDVQVVRHGAHHVGPETFALQQRQFNELAAGDVGDAQDHRVAIVQVFRQAQHQPQVLVATLGVLELDFQFKLLVLIEHGFEHLIAHGITVLRMAVDQQFPGVFGGVYVEQLQGNLIDLGDTQFPQQLLTLLRNLQPGPQVFGAVQPGLVEAALESGHIQYAQGDPGAFEDILIASAAFMQLALAAAHVQQRDQWQ